MPESLKKWKDLDFGERDRLLGIYEIDREALHAEYKKLNLKMAYTSLEAKLREHRVYRTQYTKMAAANIQIEQKNQRKYLTGYDTRWRNWMPRCSKIFNTRSATSGGVTKSGKLQPAKSAYSKRLAAS